MNNNRNNNNNRRRGRGNRNQGGGGGGGGHQGNRIDSRARGNAPQMLDKFKKLAQDAQHNGDRVQAEYYLQFADHYFRVIADNRTRQEEPRGARRDERDQDDFEMDGEDMGEQGGDDRRRFESREPRENRDTREPRRERPRRDDAQHRQERSFTGRDEQRDELGNVEPGIFAGDEGPAFEPEDNPFVRDPRPAREDRGARAERAPRRAPRPRRVNGEDAGIDAAALPPAISANDAGDDHEGEPTAPAPRRRRKASDGGTLSAVG